MKLTKKLPLISFEEFRNHAIVVKHFKSVPRLRRYEVVDIKLDVIYFIRQDANSAIPWSFSLADVYKAYSELEDFQTVSFRKYVPTRHSPARGLLLHLGLLKEQNKQ